MITITKNNRELYIGIDHPTPRPETPVITEGQIITLYEYTLYGPKYIGKYTAKTGDDEILEIGPLKILSYPGSYLEIHYKGYHQWAEFKDDFQCFDCTHYEEYLESIKKLLITDDPDFFAKNVRTAFDILEDNPPTDSILSVYDYVSYVDGVLTAGSRIRKIDGTTIKPVIENGKVYYLEIDGEHVPPKEINRIELFTLPFQIKNGKIKHFRVTKDYIQLEIHYPAFRTLVRVDPLTGELKRLIIYHGKEREDIISYFENIDPQTLSLIIKILDEKGIDAFKIIKEMGGIP